MEKEELKIGIVEDDSILSISDKNISLVKEDATEDKIERIKLWVLTRLERELHYSEPNYIGCEILSKIYKNL